MSAVLARLASRACATCRRGRRIVLLAAALWLLPGAAAAQVLVVLSENSAGYEGVAQELRADLQSERGGSLRIDSTVAARLHGIDAHAYETYELVVTVGLGAAQAATGVQVTAPPPTLCLLIPRQAFRKLKTSAASRERLSALFIDQPLSRQLDLLRLALPERHRVGVIYGPSSIELAAELGEQAAQRSLRLATATVQASSEVYPALQKVLQDSDLLLLLPDPVAVNADTAYGLLLTTYRADVPVVGFSAGLLKAGALVSLYSTAQQQGRQGARIAARILAHGAMPMPPPEYPDDFTVAVNESVARSLGLHLPAEAELRRALGDADAHPPSADRSAGAGGAP